MRRKQREGKGWKGSGRQWGRHRLIPHDEPLKYIRLKRGRCKIDRDERVTRVGYDFYPTTENDPARWIVDYLADEEEYTVIDVAAPPATNNADGSGGVAFALVQERDGIVPVAVYCHGDEVEGGGGDWV